MFDHRLRILMYCFGGAILVLSGRLFQIQVLEGSYYTKRAKQAIVLSPTSLPFVRGAILDRTGEELVSDHACWNLTLDFQTIAADAGGKAELVTSEIKRWRRTLGYSREMRPDAFLDELDRMWAEMAAFASVHRVIHPDELRRRGVDIFQQVTRVRQAVARRRGFDAPVAEEMRSHTILAALTHEQQIRARELADRFPWLHVEPASVRRIAPNNEAFAHVLGRLGRVDAETVENDPEADNPFARYVAGEQVGITGAEYLTERQVRGRRGQLTRDRDGRIIEEVEAQNGSPARLTIHAELQRHLYELLGETVQAYPHASGGAIVVLDVASREVLALVSYPGYDPARFREDYATLRDDTDRLPLRFRAVSSRYAPGSTLKPLACLSGLINGAITLDTHEVCTGYMFDNVRNAWRCWQLQGTNQRKAHGNIDVVAALTGSCNILMYRLGQKVGVDRLCVTYDMAGIGRPTGIGLREENNGINPTASWLLANRNISVTPGKARHFAIGQGEVSLTPVQVANVFATYASGRWRPLTLVSGGETTPEWTLPATREQWTAIRKGIYGVTNDPRGTAYRFAHYERDGYVLCGKTGSATADPWPTAYQFPYTKTDGTEDVAIVRAGAKKPAIERFSREHPGATFALDRVEVAQRWPVGPPKHGSKHSHAWLGGYLQRVRADGTPDFSIEPTIAFSILVEFGGSGGQTSGPLAKSVSDVLLDTFGPSLRAQPTSAGVTSQ